MSAGFFLCGRCDQVVELSERQLDAALDGPGGCAADMKCPCCHHRSVRWSGARRRPVRPCVSLERGRELFAAIRAALVNQNFGGV
jgi:hypothetical protein